MKIRLTSLSGDGSLGFVVEAEGADDREVLEHFVKSDEGKQLRMGGHSFTGGRGGVDSFNFSWGAESVPAVAAPDWSLVLDDLERLPRMERWISEAPGVGEMFRAWEDGQREIESFAEHEYLRGMRAPRDAVAPPPSDEDCPR